MTRCKRLESLRYPAFGARASVRFKVAALIALLGSIGAVPADDATGARAAAEATGVLRSRESQGWLSLESDQRQARARSAPLTPAQSRQLQIQDRQERARLAETFQQQQRQIDSLRRTERMSSGGVAPIPGQAARMRGLLMQQGQQLQGLQLQQGLNRSIQSAPTGPFGRR